jgi:hypothetical protein
MTDPDLLVLLDAADAPTRRAFACDCAERLCERYEERQGEALPERAVIDAALLVARGDLGACPDHPALVPYASRHPSPARDIATALALALSPLAQAWEIAQLLPELCATADDADDERRWMRQALHGRLASAQRTVLPPSPDVTRNLRAVSVKAPQRPDR